MDERDLSEKFNDGEFSLIFVFFGALNTVDDLKKTAADIARLLEPGGYAVLTFVNKWYLREMLVQLIKGRLKGAFARLRKVWGGYSPDRYLPSRCYSPIAVKKAFSDMNLLSRKGYSIFFPAWYNFKKFIGKGHKLDRLWNLDQKVQKTFLWSKGEYTLFVFEKN
jgi:SAM-dependent methyltransferase